MFAYNKVRTVLVVIGLLYLYFSAYWLIITKSQLQAELDDTRGKVSVLQKKFDAVSKQLDIKPETIVVNPPPPVEQDKPPVVVEENNRNEEEEDFYRRVRTRDLPDARPKACLSVKYRDDLPTFSVIIVDHNERDSLVVRTVKSVLDRSPRHLLKDIIVIDDASEPFLDSEVAVLPKTRVIRQYEQQGLIKARNLGAAESKGDVIVFLDAHCEVNYGWIEPLMDAVLAEPKVAAWPVIDIIHHTTMEYTPIDGATMVGGMDLQDLHFIYDSVPEYAKKLRKKPTDVLLTPSWPGGLFAITREYWNQWGGYDTDMGFWGTENIDMSTRIWMCGGKVVVVPCSHVGHVYRDQKAVPQYVTKSGIKARIRMAEVWLDDYKYAFYNRYGINSTRIAQAGDLTKMKAIRTSMDCKTFKWFHKEIYPNMDLPYQYLNNPDYDIWWPDEFASGRITSGDKQRVIPVWMEDSKDCEVGVLWMLYSLELIDAVNTDLIVFLEERSRSRLPAKCTVMTKDELAAVSLTSHNQPRCYAVIIKIPQELQDLKFNTIYEIYPMTAEAGFQDVLKRYHYMVKTDTQAMFTPQFSSWYPPDDKPLQLGAGAYVHDAKTKENLKAIAQKLQLRNQNEHNLGYSWYGKSDLILKIADLTFTTTKYILTNYFKEGPGQWPSWYRGVAMKYGGELAINHVTDEKRWSTKLMDGTNHAGRLCSVAQIRLWDTTKPFTRDGYFNGKYDGTDVDSLSLRHSANYTTFVALKSSAKDKTKGQLTAPNDKAKILKICED